MNELAKKLLNSKFGYIDTDSVQKEKPKNVYFPLMKERILHAFRDINTVYGDPSKYSELSLGLDALEKEARKDTEKALDACNIAAQFFHEGYQCGYKASKWIPCSERLPEEDCKSCLVQKTNGVIDILGFTKDAYKLSRYDFEQYKGKKKPIFYDWDSEYGYCEWECEAWQPLPEAYRPDRIKKERSEES